MKSQYSFTPSLAIFLLVPVLESWSPMMNAASMQKTALSRAGLRRILSFTMIRDAVHRVWYLSMDPGGNLQLPADAPLCEQPCEPGRDPSRECTQIFEPTQEGEYWFGSHIEYQLQHLAIPVFEDQWPGHQAVFIFDNATNHTTFASDALRVAYMNLSSGGNQNHNMRDNWNN